MYITEKGKCLDTKTRTVSDCTLSIPDRCEYKVSLTIAFLLKVPLTHYVPGYFNKIHKMGPIVIYYHVNTIGREYNWTHKDCPQMRTVGYNELREI